MYLICRQNFDNLCFLFPLGFTAVPREIENNALTFFFLGGGGGAGGGVQIRCIKGDGQVVYFKTLVMQWHKNNLLHMHSRIFGL